MIERIFGVISLLAIVFFIGSIVELIKIFAKKKPIPSDNKKQILITSAVFVGLLLLSFVIPPSVEMTLIDYIWVVLTAFSLYCLYSAIRKTNKEIPLLDLKQMAVRLLIVTVFGSLFGIVSAYIELL